MNKLTAIARVRTHRIGYEAICKASVEMVTIDPLDLQAAQDQDVGTLSMRHEMALSQEERDECRDHSEVQRERRVS